MFYTEADIANFKNVSFNFLITEEEGHLFTIILNRPEKRNAFTPVMINEIVYTLAYAQAQKHIWCVLIKASGPVFCAGMDLSAFQNPELDRANNSLPEARMTVNLGEAFRIFTKPSVARVEGPVLAGGFLITCGCTFVVATAEAEFSLPEVKRGLFPFQVMAALSEITSPKNALRMCVTGSSLSSAAAREIGLISHLCTKETIDEACILLAQTILDNSPFAVTKGMEAFNALRSIPANEHFSFLANRLADLRASADAQEGINAYKEKRNPAWTNG